MSCRCKSALVASWELIQTDHFGRNCSLRDRRRFKSEAPKSPSTPKENVTWSSISRVRVPSSKHWQWKCTFRASNNLVSDFVFLRDCWSVVSGSGEVQFWLSILWTSLCKWTYWLSAACKHYLFQDECASLSLFSLKACAVRHFMTHWLLPQRHWNSVSGAYIYIYIYIYIYAVKLKSGPRFGGFKVKKWSKFKVKKWSKFFFFSLFSPFL